MASSLVLPWSIATGRRAGPASVAAVGVRRQALVASSSLAAPKPRRSPDAGRGERTPRAETRPTGSLLGSSGSTPVVGTFSMEPLNTVQGPNRFPKLRIGDQRWAAAPPERCGPCGPKESPAGEGGAKKDACRDAFPCLEAAPSRHIYVPPPMADTKRHSWMSEDRDSEALPRHSGPPPNTDGPARWSAARWSGSLSLTASGPKERQSCATGQSSPQWNRKCGEAPS